MKVEVDVADLEYLLWVADDHVYWKPDSIAVADRLEDAINKAKEMYNNDQHS